MQRALLLGLLFLTVTGCKAEQISTLKPQATTNKPTTISQATSNNIHLKFGNPSDASQERNNYTKSGCQSSALME